MKPAARRSPWMLGLAVLLALAYLLLIGAFGTLTGTNRLDGSIGLVLGLYICSHPVANLIDLLFFRAYLRDQLTSRRALLGWVLVNLLVIGVGWFVIFVGVTRFTVGAGG